MTLFGEQEFRYINGNLMKENAGNVLDQYFTDKGLAEKLFMQILNDNKLKLNGIQTI